MEMNLNNKEHVSNDTVDGDESKTTKNETSCAEMHTGMNLKVGDIVEIKHDFDNGMKWNACTILEIDEKNSRIRYKHVFETIYSKYCKAYLDLASNNDTKMIYPLYTHTIKILSMISPPNITNTQIPICYHKKYIMLVCDYNDKGIYFYDVYKKIYVEEKTYQYPSYFKPENGHGAVIDKDNNLLYIFGGKNTVFGILNLNTFQLKTKHIKISNNGNNNDEQLDLCNILPYNSYIINNHIYFLNNLQDLFHIDIGTGICVKLDNMYKPEIYNNVKLGPFGGGKIIGPSEANFVYIKNENKFIAFSNYEIDTNSQTEPISNVFTSWDLDLNMNSNTYHKLIESDTKFPRLTCYNSHSNVRAVINGFDIDTVIFLIVIDPKNGNLIACFDTMTNKWYTKNATFVFTDDMEFKSYDHDIKIIRDDKYYVHLFSFDPKIMHFKVSLFDMIPIELENEYAKYYMSLVYGYIRIKIQNKMNYNIINDIQQIILSYFPLFI